MLFKKFQRNTAGRDLIVGDVHGHFTKLQAALDAVGFNPAEDRLFSVGDLVDRGPECDQALEWLAKPWFHAVSGNHEDMAIRWPKGFMDAGTYTMNGGGCNVANTREAQLEFASAFAALPVAIEIETASGPVGIVHADVPSRSWARFTEDLQNSSLSKAALERVIDSAQWSRNRIDRLIKDDVIGVRAVVVGHTPVRNITVLGNAHYIDTYGWRDGQFTLLDAETLERAAGPTEIANANQVV